ncbi:hypothetical protein LXA21_17880, partial [Erwinia amylovora]|uniref:hypothetical protein n=1 Tax=Erwinia amylovora TaxID=552 RepID=UPI0020BFBEC4
TPTGLAVNLMAGLERLFLETDTSNLNLNQYFNSTKPNLTLTNSRVLRRMLASDYRIAVGGQWLKKNLIT